jgi:hypothetical protein
MPGVFKVGRTSRSVAERLSELNSSTSIPTKFIAEYSVEVNAADSIKVEQRTHAILRYNGFHHGKEYFKCDIQACKDAIIAAIVFHNIRTFDSKDKTLLERRVALERERQRAQAEAQAQSRLRKTEISRKEREIQEEFELKRKEILSFANFKILWGLSTLSILVARSNIAPGKDSNFKLLLFSIVTGGIIAWLLQLLIT